MADALFITGSVDYDGSDWYVEDPLYVELTVKDPTGAALSSADVTVALVTDDETAETKKTVQADADGKVSVSLTAGAVGVYDVIAGAKTSSREGYADIESKWAAPQPPFSIGAAPATTTAGALDTDLSKSDHSITTSLV